MSYFIPFNALNNQKRAMRHAMRKPQDIPFKIFAARLTELNIYLPLLPGSSAAKKIYSEELKNILLHAVPNLWGKKTYIQGWGFEGSSYKETCEIFKRMDIAEAIYKGVSPSKNTQWAESNSASSGRKKNGGVFASPSKPDQGCAGKHKRNSSGRPSYQSTGAKKTCLTYGPGNSSEKCKVLKYYTDKGSAQNTYMDKQARSGANKCARNVKFDDTKQEVNTMKSYDGPIKKKKKGKIKRKPKSDQANEYPSEDDQIYGIERLNLGKPAHDL